MEGYRRMSKCPNCGADLQADGSFCPICGIKVSPSDQDKRSLLVKKANDCMTEIGKVIKGKDDVIAKVLMAIFASGHVLLEDNPGTGKTTLAKAISNAIDLDYNRQQFTPDTMPSDIIGYTFYRNDLEGSIYVPGVVNCNLLLADEINRTSAKTQAALLEAMEEKTVTVEGETRQLPDPFFVIATQNPVTSMGTQPLPDSQCDRFLIRISMGYPDKEKEIEVLMQSTIADISTRAEQVMSCEDLRMICRAVDGIYAGKQVCAYIQRLVENTRNDRYVEVGVSTRGAIAILRMARARAFMEGRDYVTPQDVREVFVDVCNHRIILSTHARMEELDEYQILHKILDDTMAEKLAA